MANKPLATGNEPVPSYVRAEILDADGYRCQLCGEAGPEAGGIARLEVHHKEPDPDGDRHAVENLITLCQDCHHWHHLRLTPDELSVELTAGDRELLRPHDFEIIQRLAEQGPMTTGEIADAIRPDLTLMAVRERLYHIMSLDQLVSNRQTQLIDKDVETGQWGLSDDIVHSERSRIPLSLPVLLQRIEDERVRRAIDRDVDRKAVANVLGISYRSTYVKEKRARALQFPLDSLTSDRGRPARVHPQEGEIALDARRQLRLTAVTDGQSNKPDASAPDDCDATELVNDAQGDSDEEVRSD